MKRRYGFGNRARIGAQGLTKIIKYLEGLEQTKSVTDVSKDREYQKKDIDLLWKKTTGPVCYVEVKTNKWGIVTGNFFFETWSVHEKRVKGWFYTSEADYIFYLINNNLYILPLQQIRKINLEKYKEKSTQTIRKGKTYTTIGRLVPIKDVLESFNVEMIHL